MLTGGGMARPPVGMEMEIEVGSACPRRLPAPADPGRPPLAPPRRLPQVGTDHHRIFQTLAAVDRDDRHRPIDPITMGLVLLGHLPILRQPQPPQPGGGGGHPQLVGMDPFLHQLRRLLQIGQLPPPQGQAGQAGGAQQVG